MLRLRQETLLSMFAITFLFLGGNAAVADDKIGAVQGKVNFKGKPIDEGKITFHLDNGQFVGCKIKNGDYKIDQVLCGARKVSVEAKGIPARYCSEETTPLSVEIAGGRQNMDFDLNE